MRKVINFYSILISIGLGAILLTIMILNEPKNFRVVQASHIDYSEYITEKDIEEEVLGVTYPVAEYEPWVPEMTEMEMTFYTDKGICRDNKTQAREGVCAVQEWRIGQTAIVYSMDDELIGIYECCDTGFGRDKDGDKVGTIQEGKTIDIFKETDKEGWDFISKYGNKVKVQFIHAEG